MGLIKTELLGSRRYIGNEHENPDIIRTMQAYEVDNEPIAPSGQIYQLTEYMTPKVPADYKKEIRAIRRSKVHTKKSIPSICEYQDCEELTDLTWCPVHLEELAADLFG